MRPFCWKQRKHTNRSIDSVYAPFVGTSPTSSLGWTFKVSSRYTSALHSETEPIRNVPDSWYLESACAYIYIYIYRSYHLPIKWLIEFATSEKYHSFFSRSSSCEGEHWLACHHPPSQKLLILFEEAQNLTRCFFLLWLVPTLTK